MWSLTTFFGAVALFGFILIASCSDLTLTIDGSYTKDLGNGYLYIKNSDRTSIIKDRNNRMVAGPKIIFYKVDSMGIIYGESEASPDSEFSQYVTPGKFTLK